MRMPRNTMMQAILLISLLVPGCESYRRGDIVPALNKLQSSAQMNTDAWSDVLYNLCPRFRVDKQVMVPIAATVAGTQPDHKEVVRVMLSFDRQRFTTPFILVSDGKETFLEFVQFTFVHSGDDIIDFSWKAHYTDEDDERHGPPTHLNIDYKWVETSEQDITTGIGSLLFGGWLMSFGMLLYIIVDTQLKVEDSKSRSPQLSAAHPNYSAPPSSQETYVVPPSQSKTIVEEAVDPAVAMEEDLLVDRTYEPPPTNIEAPASYQRTPSDAGEGTKDD
eukprot:TRINITY_DN8455_c0_g1_i1.p1 TRINITY_DN8455_c0_g1~~TRINITY_DN8455_c0_g1_i1.p1  ORF type:complete len:277 (+),score=42.88 TRINITY_DN8455_c0_g1_i1:56-886(+)